MKKVTLIALVAALLLAACAPAKPTLLESIPHTQNELIYNDILATNFSSLNTTVFGVSIGMNEDDVLAKLGAADQADLYDFGAIKNWLYGEKLGFNQTAVIYHIENGIVTRIIVMPTLDSMLIGKSRVVKDKASVYGDLGIPERQYSTPQGRFFVYNKKGFEVYLNRDKEYQYAFVYPNRKLPSLVYENKTLTAEELTKPTIPILITDTTTLCDQGITFGQDPETKECKWFKNSCDIPDYWNEVVNCENATQ